MPTLRSRNGKLHVDKSSQDQNENERESSVNVKAGHKRKSLGMEAGNEKPVSPNPKRRRGRKSLADEMSGAEGDSKNIKADAGGEGGGAEGNGGEKMEGTTGKEVRGNKDVGAENAGTEYSEKVKAEAVEKRKETLASNTSKPTSTNGSTKNEPKIHDNIPASAAKNDDPSLIDNEVITSSSTREKSIPSTILEKGIIYFFFRARVNVDDPSSANDVARSFMVLRPLPLGAKIEGKASDGDEQPTLPDGKNARIIILPKKILPKSKKDRFLVYVDKAGVSVQELKEEFVAGKEYETKTQGHRHKPPATPFGEGIYAITTTGHTSHLVYILTTPSSPGSIQREMGLSSRGSYILSAKNPSKGGPPNTNNISGKKVEYSKEIMDEFRDLRWMPAQPRMMDYEGAQFLLMGEEFGKIDKAMEDPTTSGGDAGEKGLEELEKLEGEEEIRIKHLDGDDPIFEDLDLTSKEYKGLQTSW